MSIVKVEKHNYTVEPFYQWDRNQVLEIHGLSLPSTPEVHFCNNTMGRAIVRQATMDSTGIITVSVPNGLLQKPYTITAHLCIYTGATFETHYTLKLPITPRTQPADYTIEDDGDVYSFNALDNKVEGFLQKWDAKYANLDADFKRAAESFNEAAESYENTTERMNEVDDELSRLEAAIATSRTVASYLAFAGNLNEESVSAGFGKNNEDIIQGVGRALAMYAWFKGENKSEHPFTNLVSMATLDDLSDACYDEIIKDDYVRALIESNPYGSEKVFTRYELKFESVGSTSKTEDVSQEITVTEEDLKRSLYFVFDAWCGGGRMDATLTIDGEAILSNENKYEEEGIKSWSDLGITSPGTYTFRLYTNNTVSWQGSASCIITKMRG